MRKIALILALALALAPATGSAARKKRKKHHARRPVATQPAKAPSSSPEGDAAAKGTAAGSPTAGPTDATATTTTAASASSGASSADSTPPATPTAETGDATATSASAATAAPATDPGGQATTVSATEVGVAVGAEATSTATLHEVDEAPAPGLVQPPHEGTMPHAGPQGHGLSIAAKIGGTYPTSKLGVTYMGALELAWAPPVLKDLLPIGTITLGVELGYVQPKLSSSSSDPAVGDYSYELDQRLFTGDLDATLVVPLRMLKAYGGVGLGVYLLRARIDSFDQVNTETQTRSGLQLRGGASLAMGPGDLFAELRYHYVHLQFLSTGSSNAGGVTLAAGYRYSF